METDQFHTFFLPELQKNGYDGVFSPKSRAKTMSEQDRRYVDGCAIFYRQSKYGTVFDRHPCETVRFPLVVWRFRLIKHHLVEFNQLAMSAANGTACHDMMNRVMTKDNIGLVAFFETKEEIYSHTFSNGKKRLLLLSQHVSWLLAFRRCATSGS
jgi:CCR4-NOT transcription complex subunit 6